jgi:hypothetical protein
MHLELFFVMLLISHAIVVVFSFLFFSWRCSSVPQREYAVYVIPCRVLIVVPIVSFLPSVRGLKFLLFNEGAGALLQLQRECWVSVHCGW